MLTVVSTRIQNGCSSRLLIMRNSDSEGRPLTSNRQAAEDEAVVTQQNRLLVRRPIRPAHSA